MPGRREADWAYTEEPFKTVLQMRHEMLLAGRLDGKVLPTDLKRHRLDRWDGMLFGLVCVESNILPLESGGKGRKTVI